MKLPADIDAALRRIAAEQSERTITQPQAVTALREAIEQDPAYVRVILAGHAARLLAAWRRSRPPAIDPVLAEMLPGLPPLLYVAPGRPVNPMDCTRYGLDMARNMLFARTANQVQGGPRRPAANGKLSRSCMTS